MIDDAAHASDRLAFTPAAAGAEIMPLLRPASRGMSKLATSPNGPKREVFGFAPYWLLSHYGEWDYTALSTIVYFGLNPNLDGSIATSGGGWNGWSSSDLVNMINLAHSSGVRVVVAFKTSDNGVINNIGTNPPVRQAFVNNVINAIQSKGLDGVNIDFEGSAPDPLFPNLQAGMTAIMTDLNSQVHAKWPQAEVSIDTYAGAASWDQGLFKIGDLAPVVDAMFIMAYDSVFSNMSTAGPNAPLNGWTFNDTIDVQQYLTKAPASKIILGVPYYGYRWATKSGDPYSPVNPFYTGTNPIAEGYSAAMDDLSCPHPALRPAWDSTGASPWASWWSPPTNDPCGDNLGSPVELYYDNASSLGLKYDVVNANNLRGTGMWALGMDSGRSELWSALHTYFSCPVTLSVATITTSEFTLMASAGTCSVSYYDLQQYDVTDAQGWFPLPATAPSNGVAGVTVEGYPGHSYELQARAHTSAGLVSSWAVTTVAVPSTATYAHAFKGMYTLDAYGGISADASPPLGTSAYWGGWRIARAAKAWPGATSPQSGFVLDGWGGLHPYGAPGLAEAQTAPNHYWPGWDIARDFAFLPDGSGGFVLDGWGGLHAFRVNGNTAPLAAQATGYWPGWDIARKVVIFPDGTGGYVMDAWGGLHPFGINGPSPVKGVTASAYWPGWNIARDVVIVSGHSGYTLDGFGGVHEFHETGAPALPAVTAPAYWGGWDIARGIWFVPGSTTAGYTLDGWGGLHPFGSAPAVAGPYWSGQDIALGIAGG